MLLSKGVVMIKPSAGFFRIHSLVFSALILAFVLALAAPGRAWCQAQGEGQQPPQTSPDLGGPSADSGAIAIPKKAPVENVPPPAAAPAEPKIKLPEGTPAFSMRVEVPEVTVDVGVLLEKNHQFISGLKPANFRVYEDGVEQKIEGFKRVDAPITALLLCEFAARGYAFRYEMLNSAAAFTQQLRPQDYVAMMTFDLNTHIVSDFTQDKKQIEQGLNRLAAELDYPMAFSETDVFDALSESLDRMSRIEGQKYIVLIASGIDTLSKLTLDKILQKVKNSHDITIFSISTGGFLQARYGGGGGINGGMMDMTFMQAENQMRTFAQMTGGMYFNPRFSAELPDDIREINSSIRSKYELIYRPSNTKQDGGWRKLRVVLVDDEGQPLRMQDEKKKPLKYDIIARDGYRARQQVE